MESLKRFFKSLGGYSRPFWVANISELFERIAFYGTTSMLVLYLSENRGIDKGEAQRLGGIFGGLVYSLPVLSGVLADLMGYRRALMLAYALLATGYFLVGQLDTYWAIAGALLVVALGASLVKPTITGTVQKTCSESQRAVGFSIYYTLVNVGGGLGPQIAGRLRKAFDPRIGFYVSSAAALVALVLIAVAFRKPIEGPGERKSLVNFGKDFLRVVSNWRLVALFVLVAGFWVMFFSLYGPFPLYIKGPVHGDDVDVGNLQSIESLGVICLTVVIGFLTRRLPANRAFMIGVLLGAIAMVIVGLYPSLYVAAGGVFVLALGEITYSAHFYKYLGDMAPPDQVGMYMGFAFLPIALGYFTSGQLGAALGDLPPRLLWLSFAGVGLVGVVGIFLLTEVFKPKASPPVTQGAA